jgi:eukaryotic-like serine/threonine-protein kinase
VPRSEQVVDDLVDAILDGTPIDWAAAESSCEGAAPPLLRQLKVLAALAELHRGVPLSTLTLSQVAPSRVGPEVREAPVLWGHLRLVERIGRGAFGEVYRAWDTRLDREVALKLLPAGRSSGDRAAPAIIHEGRLLARVRHPNVVTIHGAEQIGDQIGLWMEFVRGRTLEQIVDQRKVVSAAEAVDIGLELCGAVSAVHGAGLLHRDIKAHNVMRSEDGRIVLMDFGTGRELEDDASSDLAGTPLYLAPERGKKPLLAAIFTVSASCCITSSPARTRCRHEQWTRCAVPMSATNELLFRPRGAMCHRGSPASSSVRSNPVPSAATKAQMLSQRTWQRCSRVRDWHGWRT